MHPAGAKASLKPKLFLIDNEVKPVWRRFDSKLTTPRFEHYSELFRIKCSNKLGSL